MKIAPLRILGSTLSLFGQRSARMLGTLIGMLLVVTALSLTAQPAFISLVGHWNFDEGSGLFTEDSSGWNNTGHLMDGPVWWQNQSLAHPVALLFDGVNDHVDVGNAPALNPSDEITLAAWIAPYDLSASGEIIAKSNGTDPQYYLRVQAGGKIRFGIGGTVLNGNTTLSPSVNFQLVAGTYDGSTMKIYVDGVLDAVMSKNGPMHDNGVDVWIGCRHFHTPLAFSGLIDDPRIYSRALSANEIQSLVTPGTVVITSPATGQTFLPGDGVFITADVFNFSAPVTKVDFYEGSTPIGTATQAPYSVTYYNPFIDNSRHSIEAVATDTAGNTVSSAPGAFWFNFCDDTFTIAYLAAPSASVFIYGDPILISVGVYDPCGTFSNRGVDFYDNGVLLAHHDAASAYRFDFVWQNAPPGHHQISARLIDPNDNSYFISPTDITVVVPGNQAPTVAIASPLDGAVFTAPADVPVHVTAQDPDGSVVQIQLTDGTTTFTSTATDFDYTFPSLALGNYTLTATATDNAGATGSSSIQVSVVIPGPANDDFADSFDLAQITAGNNVNATREPSEPVNYGFGHSVWWHYTAPSDGLGVISTVGSSFPTGMAIYTGNSLDNLNFVTWYYDFDKYQPAIVWFNLIAGTTYQIVVDGLTSAWGDIQLSARYDVPPTFAITSPTDGAVFTAPADVPVHVTAQDSDGSVVQIDLTLIGLTGGTTTTFTSTVADLDYTFHSLAVGNYQLIVRVTDNLGVMIPNSVVFTVQ